MSEQLKGVARCPVCRAQVAARVDNPAFPFCSARCKQIDLGRWLQEDYRISGEPGEAGAEQLGLEEEED
jgi:endogenous inhibitor of DNA gyrase (YacG/DUF329 family)